MEKETNRIIVMKNGEVIIDKTDPTTVILSITEKMESHNIQQQMLVIGDPKDVFMASKRLEENVQKQVMSKMKEILESKADDPTAKSLLRLMKLMDMLSSNTDNDDDESDEEPDCDTCPAKNDCPIKDEMQASKPSKGCA